MRATASLVLVAVTLLPVASLVACDRSKAKEGPETGIAPAASSAPGPTAATVDTALAPLGAGTAGPVGNVTTPPGTRAVRLPDGGLALLNDAGQMIADAGHWPGFALPSALPSGMAIPGTMPSTMPTQLPIPSAFPVPSGFTLPTIPGLSPSAKK